MDSIKETTLQQLRIVCNKVITSKQLEHFCNNLTVNNYIPETIDGMLIQLSGWVWAKKPDRKEVITGIALVPKNGYQHLKGDLFNLFYKWKPTYWITWKLLNKGIFKHVKLKEIKIKREIELQTFYPTLNILSHEPYLTLVELETDNKYYEESK